MQDIRPDTPVSFASDSEDQAEVEFSGVAAAPAVGIDEVAAAADTISYEILTGLGRRLVREYVEND